MALMFEINGLTVSVPQIVDVEPADQVRRNR